MAILINDGMSPALYDAIRRVRDGYQRTGYLSTTSCIDSPRIRVLTNRYEGSIVRVASDYLPSFIGTCVHGEIERYDRNWEIDGVAQEREFTIDVGGITFSGRPDWYSRDDEEVGDEKTTSTWTYVFNPQGKKDHIAQININAYLLRRNGLPCTKGFIEYIFLDWKLSQKQRDPSYPPRVVIVRPEKLWSDEMTLKYIEDRVSLHLAAETMDDENLPFCSEEEQWRKPHQWAVVKKGNKRAYKVYETLEEAETAARGLGRHTTVEERPGERTRCEFYCEVKPWCNQYTQEQIGNGKAEAEAPSVS